MSTSEPTSAVVALSRQGDNALEISPPPLGTAPATSATGASVQAQVVTAGVWNIAGRTVVMVANLVATPFTIRLLGAAGYGLWALVQSVVMWGDLAEGGMWAATTKLGAERYAEEDASGEARVVWSGLLVVLVATSAVSLAIGVSAGWIVRAFNVPHAEQAAGAWTLRVAAVTVVLSSLIGSANTAQQIRLQWVQLTKSAVVSNLLSAVGTPVAIYVVSRSAVTAAAVGLLASAIYLTNVFRGALRLQPALRRPTVDRHTVGRLLRYGGPLTMANVALLPLYTADKFFLAANASATAVAYYAVALTVATTLQILPEELGSPLLPALARLRAEGKDAEHASLYGKSITGMFLLATPSAVMVALLAQPFLRLWAGPAFAAHSTSLLLVALVGVWASALAFMPASFLLAESRTKTVAVLQATELLPYLAGAWLLTAKWGAIGAATAWSGRLVVDAVAHFAIVGRSTSLPIMPLLTQRVRAVVAPATFGLLCLGTASLTGNFVTRCAIGGALFIGYFAAVWWFVLSEGEQRGLRTLLQDVRPSWL